MTGRLDAIIIFLTSISVYRKAFDLCDSFSSTFFIFILQMLRPPPSEENRRSFASETTVPTKHTEERRLRHVAATCTVEELDKWMGPKNTITMVPQWSPIIRLHLLSSFGLNIDLRIWFDFFRNNIATRQFYNGNAVPSYLRRMFPSTLRKFEQLPRTGVSSHESPLGLAPREH